MKQRWPLSVVLLAAVAAAFPVAARADQSSQPTEPAAGRITAGSAHSCAIVSADARCWGFGGNGRLGHGASTSIGDDETPGMVAAIDVGAGRRAVALSADQGHTCAQLDDGTLRCWGFGGNGRLGYGNTADVGDVGPPGAAGPVDVGAGRTVRAVSAGGSHTCVALDDGSVRCFGYGAAGQLGYGDNRDIGDDETPGSVAPVDLGAGRTAVTVTAGESHTCALLDGGSVRCWGFGAWGQLGNVATVNVGDNESPAAFPTVDLGAGRTATAISAGSMHTCALLDDGSVRCWGFGANGQLGYGNLENIGDDEAPGLVGPVDLGPGRTARAISAGRQHTCAVLDDFSVRCWGAASFGQLGYGNQTPIGDDETPGSAGPVDLGQGRTAVAVAAGDLHTCALLDDDGVRCWGYGANGRLGLCSETTIGDDETPAAARPVDFGAAGAGCAAPVLPVTPGGDASAAPPAVLPPAGFPPAPAGAAPSAAAPAVDPRALESARRRALRACLRSAARKRKAQRVRARRACLARHGRTPGRVTGLRARPVSRTRVVLTFNAAGSDGRNEPAARSYSVRQSLRPLRRSRDFARAPSLCRGSCRFAVSAVGSKVTLAVTGLRRNTTYFYAVAARDNVSGRLGPRSRTVRVRTR